MVDLLLLIIIMVIILASPNYRPDQVNAGIDKSTGNGIANTFQNIIDNPI